MIDATIVVSSFDGFRATWEPFRHGFQKYWPDCPWPVKFITNFLDAPLGETVKMGDDGGVYGWSSFSRRALELVHEPVVLWIHDDNWLSRRVDTETMIGLVRLFGHEDLHLIRLSNCYMATTCGVYRHHGKLRMMHPDSRQRCSLQPSLWRRETLIELLVDDESPWKFEGEAPHRAREQMRGDFLCCQEGFWPLHCVTHVDPDWDQEAVCRGKWTVSAVKYAVRERVSVDFSVHPNGNRNTEVPY